MRSPWLEQHVECEYAACAKGRAGAKAEHGAAT
uniref:Uncharacterized protein n=1 Tax=Mycobacterium kansasii TaxID=1768 RepID=A0A653EFK3_MYCKA|nr:hypothetical protein BIN_B_00228 [Mycobacterium kansasii]